MADLTQAEAAFWRLKADDGTGLRTSSGVFYNHTVFARDVAMIARWILPLGQDYQEVSREVILTLCWHQGVADNPRAEEQPGRIHNEYRKFAVWDAPGGVKLMGRLVSLLWGGNLSEYTSYIAVDTTPLFIQLVCAYASQVDRNILNQVVVRHDGRQASVRQCLDEAIAWILSHRDKYGLISVRRSNPFSLNYQIWKDSHTALIHSNRRLGSLSRPVIYLETQMLAVDALRAASELLQTDRLAETLAWRKFADELVSATMEHFWDASSQRFYVALDHNKRGQLRHITTPGSSPGWLLDSSFFDSFSASDREHYVAAIVRPLMGPDFLTAAGIRARAVGSDNWLKVADYHGSFAVWPVDSYVLARGLRRHGLPLLAQALERRVLRAVDRAGAFNEYFLVGPDGRVLYQPHHAVANRQRSSYRGLPHLPVQILPEHDLAWTIALCLLLQKTIIIAGPPSQWTHAIQAELLPNFNELGEEDTSPPFVPDIYSGIARVIQVAAGQWIREYVLRR